MHRKQLSLSVLTALVVLFAAIAILWSRLGPAPEHSLQTPVTTGSTARSLPELVDVAKRATAMEERIAESTLEPSTGETLTDTSDEPPADARPGLAGVVVDALGVPVGGAGVWVHTRRHFSSIPWTWARRTRLATHTDADGSFVLDVDRIDKLEARASGHVPSRIEFVPVEGASIVLTLRGSAARLTGSVSAGGSAVALARLDLRRPRLQVSNDEHANRRFPAGEDGSFMLDDLAPGSATLIASAPGFAPHATPLELRSGETTDVRIMLVPGAILTGIVVGPDQEPIAGAQVVAPEREPPAIAHTDGLGTFTWTGLAPGALRIVASCPGFEDAEHVSTLGVGENARCTIVLVPLARLEGRVVDAAGAPVAEITVEARQVGLDPSRPSTARDVSNADGSFRIEVQSGSEHAFVLREPNQWLAIDASWLGTFVAPQADILITLRSEDRASAFVIGRVVDEGGPLAGASFQVGDGERLGTVGVNTPGTPVSDEAGRFRIGPLPAREFMLVVKPADSTLPTFRSAPFSLAPGEVRDLGDLVLPLRATLVGRAFFEDGQPAARAALQLDMSDGEQQIFRFGDDGTLERGLLPGSYQATIYGTGFLDVHREFTLAAGEVEFLELVLRRAIRCPLDVTLPGGETAGLLRLSAADGSQEFEFELDGSMHVLWPALTTGEHLAELTCEGGRSYSARFDAAPPDGSDKALVLMWRKIE